ncbi:MAG: hypothetical protein ABR517_14625 [Thermoanaerobaculia bacterium]
MKKFLTLTGLMLLVAATAMAGVGEDRLFVQPNATFPTGSPATTNNDDSCDISVMPAATLLLPYFEVEINEEPSTALNTLFTIVNTSPLPQIAHITLWTDWSYPVIDFNVFLTGYDVQGLSLYNIIARGDTIGIPPTSSSTDEGIRSATNDDNPAFLVDAVATCAVLPGPIPTDLANAIKNALSTGIYTGFCGSTSVGSNTPGLAKGYVTIDTARTCSQSLPTDGAYFASEIAFDNVLTGDYIRVNPDAGTGNFAGGTPLVHIRAIPDGYGEDDGGLDLPTNLPFTFYDRYTPLDRTRDRRQPLPGTFAARYIAGEPFATEFAIWREGTTATAGGVTLTCGSVAPNASIAFTEFVRFDESENPTVRGGGIPISPAPPTAGLPEASSVPAGSSVFPPFATGTTDNGGWIYMNLNNGYTGTNYSAPRRATHPGRSQNWVTVQMSAEGRYAVDFDATMLGNGCSPVPGTTTGAYGGNPIEPADDVTP